MARFLPYDQTGFDRVGKGGTAGRDAFGTKARWMDPSKMHKSKDWSSSEGIKELLGLASAVIQNPVTDMAVKGIDAMFNKGGKVVPQETANYELLMEKAAHARDQAEKVGSPHPDGPTGPIERQKRLLADADIFESEAHELSGNVVDSMDDLFSFVAREGATKEDLSFALSNVSRFSSARTGTQMRKGVDTGTAARKQMLEIWRANQKGSMSDYQGAMVRLREGNYKSMDQKRKDDTLVRNMRAEHYGNKIDHSIKLMEKRGQKIDQEVSNLLDLAKGARTEKQFKALRVLVTSLGKDWRRKYPPVYATLKDLFASWGVSLDGPGDIIDKQKARRLKFKKNTGDPGGREGSVEDLFKEYSDALGNIKIKFQEGGHTPEQLIDWHSKVVGIKRVLSGYQINSRVSKGDVRRNKSGVFLIHPETRRELGDIIDAATSQATNLNRRLKRTDSSAKAADVEKRLLASLYKVKKGKFGNIKIVAGKGGYSYKKPSSWGKLVGKDASVDGGSYQDMEDIKKAFDRLQSHVIKHGRKYFYKKGGK